MLFKVLGRQTYRLRWMWIAAGIVVLYIGIFYGIKVFASLKSGGTEDASSGSAREAVLMAREFPKSRISMILLASSPTVTVDSTQFRTSFAQLIANVAQDPSQPNITSYYNTGDSHFVCRNRRETFALIGVSGDQDAAYLRIRQKLNAPGLAVQLGGPAVADYEINAEVAKDLPKLGAISGPLLLILLLVIFRSVIAAALPLIIGAVSVLGAFAVVRVFSHYVGISVFAANIVSLLGLGLAIDYSLLYVSRFRDELAAGQSVEAAIATCTTTAGESIFLSGTTVALSLLGLLAFPEMFLRSMGLGGAIAVVVAMASSLSVLPSILSVLGHNVDLLTLPLIHRQAPERGNSAWGALGKFVVRWPIPVLVISLGLLLAAGIPFLHVKYANPGLDSLPGSFQSRQVSDIITRDFESSENPPIELLLTMPSSPMSASELPLLYDYVQRLKNLNNVQTVSGISSLDLQLPAAVEAYLLAEGGNPQLVRLKTQYLSGTTTLITINYKGASDAYATQNLVRAVRSLSVPHGSRVLVGGDTAELVDRLSSLTTHLPYAIAIIFVLTFVVLLVMLQSVVIPLKAIVLNTLSLSAAFGLMTWIFQDGHLHGLLRFTSSGSLDPTLPVLIFAIAFGLATDYEVFLVSRIKEEYHRTGSNSEAVIIGVEKTGGIITAAGLLLVIVVAAFGMSDILSMKEMGVGLAVAVAVDATIVRTLLVPAAMVLFGKLNWWLPGNQIN